MILKLKYTRLLRTVYILSKLYCGSWIQSSALGMKVPDNGALVWIIQESKTSTLGNK
jgi:hypothetical protein